MRWWSERYRVRFGQGLVLGLSSVVLGAALLTLVGAAPAIGWDVYALGGLFGSSVFAAVMAGLCEPGTSVWWGNRRRRPASPDPSPSAPAHSGPVSGPL